MKAVPDNSNPAKMCLPSRSLGKSVVFILKAMKQGWKSLNFLVSLWPDPSGCNGMKEYSE